MILGVRRFQPGRLCAYQKDADFRCLRFADSRRSTMNLRPSASNLHSSASYFGGRPKMSKSDFKTTVILVILILLGASALLGAISYVLGR